MIIVKNAGNPSEISPKFISLTEAIINRPTTISTGAVAATGITMSNGAKNKDAIKSPALGTIIGSALGTSPHIVAVESAAGIAEGGRTGLTALTIAGLFIASLF